MHGIGREFWDRVSIVFIEDSRELERPVAIFRGVRDVMERPWNEVIVVVESYCFLILIIVRSPNLAQPVLPLKYTHFLKIDTNMALV